MPIDFLTFMYQIFKDFGVNVVFFGIIIYLLWKLGSNHLTHISADVKSCIKGIDNLSKEITESEKRTDVKIENLNEKVEAIGERTSKVEGKLGI